MANYNKLFSLDKDTLEFIESVPKMERSKVVRESIKMYKNNKKESEKPQIPQKPRVKIIG